MLNGYGRYGRRSAAQPIAILAAATSGHEKLWIEFCHVQNHASWLDIGELEMEALAALRPHGGSGRG